MNSHITVTSCSTAPHSSIQFPSSSPVRNSLLNTSRTSPCTCHQLAGVEYELIGPADGKEMLEIRRRRSALRDVERGEGDFICFGVSELGVGSSCWVLGFGIVVRGRV